MVCPNVTPSILVVEDDSAVRELLTFVLRQNNFEIIEVDNAETAQQELYRKHPGLILLDWMLPGMSGVDFAKNIGGYVVYLVTGRDVRHETLDAILRDLTI